MSLETSIFIAIALLLGNAYFVGAEFGLISVRRTAIELRALKGSRAAKITLDAMENVSLMLAGAQLGVTVCSLGLGAIAEPMIVHLLEPLFEALGVSAAFLHPISFAVALAIMVYLHVVIGETIPKNIALADSEHTAIVLIPPLAVMVKFLRPIVVGLNNFANGCLKLFGVKTKGEIPSAFTRDEVAGFVQESHREGLLSENEQYLLTGVLSLDEKSVGSVVVNLNKLTILKPSVTPAEIEKHVEQTGFSRFPISNLKGGLAGYIHLKDILQIDQIHKNEPLPKSYIRPLSVVPIDVSLRRGLSIMQHSHSHFAQVRNGKTTVGVVMLEDILEELVGEIHDDSRKELDARVASGLN